MTRGRTLMLACALVLGSACGSAKRTSEAPTTEVTETARKSFARGVEHMNAGADEYDDAIGAFRTAIKQTPDLWEAHLNVGVIELRRARLGAAARSLEASIEIYPSPQALEALGEVYMRQGRAKQAVELYERALAGNPQDLRLRNRLAVALRHAGRLDAAEAEIRAILGQDAANVDAYSTLGAIQLDRGNLDLAELVLNRGLKRHADDPKLLTNLGLVALRRGDDQAAFVLFEKASQADPSYLTGRLNRAAVYLGVGDHSRAREELEYILKIEPGNTEALIGLGVAQRLAGDLAAARATWEQLLAVDPDNGAVHYNLGVLAMDFEEKPADAQKHLERYLQLVDEEHPRASSAKERIELLKALKKGGS